MNKLIILSGISGSGKSTFASTTVRHNPNRYVLVNRDKIRELLYGYTEETITKYYTRNDFFRLEKQVTEVENCLIKDGLSRGKVVIVDATHLKQKYIERFKFFNVNTEIIYFDTSLEEAIERDSNRNRKVGEEIIKRQYESYKHLKDLEVEGWEKETVVLNSNLPNCIIFDIDGTLAHKGDRSPYDWKRVLEDGIDLAVGGLYQNLLRSSENHPEFNLIICTGRDEVCREETLNWLTVNELKVPKELHMRQKDDNRPDWVVKREMWEDVSKRHDILFMVDDRCQVVDYARSLGLKVFQVEYGNF